MFKTIGVVFFVKLLNTLFLFVASIPIWVICVLLYVYVYLMRLVWLLFVKITKGDVFVIIDKLNKFFAKILKKCME